MTIFILCLLLVCVMPFLAKIPLAWAMQQQDGYDNHHPRAQQQALTGFGARANAAHYNCFEAITYFAPAALTVLALSSIGALHMWLAVAFVVLRVIYLFCYWYDIDKVRSLCFIGGLGISVALFLSVL
ncbi:MAPEG family protein [Alteromonas gilva]|uniref:MAPEG family protein n=1 Tax=Alteromonas gilva TaxID=2987522 RepID=A0ABT5L6C4_9ALTE|nr:MAPEG family protein [Alteromonas gilva]MDC8832576.1 MAPEG family protein [Alteromonas gilva]